MDVDFFKRYNDALGHPAGDACLVQVAAAISRESRGGELVARYGGEEFVVLLPETDGIEALIVAQRLHEAVDALAMPHPDRPDGDRLSISVGVATHPGGASGGKPERLLERADAAMYSAKEQGRDRVVAAPRLRTIHPRRRASDRR